MALRKRWPPRPPRCGCTPVGLENYPRLIDRLAEIRPLLGNEGRAVRQARDPMVLKTAAAEAGLPFPITVSGGNGQTSFDGNQRRWLSKLRRSSGGVGIQFVEPTQDKRRSSRWWLQEFVEGESASAVFVAGAAGPPCSGYAATPGRGLWFIAALFVRRVDRSAPPARTATSQLGRAGRRAGGKRPRRSV